MRKQIILGIKQKVSLKEVEEMIEKNNLFYERLKELVKSNGKSINRVERDLGYPRNSLNNYKNGGSISGKRLIEVATYFNISPEYLIGVSDEKQLRFNLKSFQKLTKEQKIEIVKAFQEWTISNLTE